MRIALGLEYDGSGFWGWQSQPQGQTVQATLENALRQLAAHDIRVHAAGRTDTGVHALMQVVHFDTTALRPEQAWVRGTNAHLPASIRVRWAKAVAPDFHARFDATRRSYQYVLFNHEVAPALMAGKTGWFHAPLDLAAMQEGIAYLLGEHDFSAFRASECQAKSPVKTLYNAQVHCASGFFIFDFCANAFLHHQVRNMVGALVYIGKGRYPPVFIRELLALGDRKMAPPTFSPAGLYLTGVAYAEKWGLPDTTRQINEVMRFPQI